jgi:gliding motility-associated-like protein
MATREGADHHVARVAAVFLTLILVAVNYSSAQNPTDCATALPVCSNGTINENSNGPGINDFAFPGNYPGCLVTNEHQSVWLYVQVESGSTLGFDIIPNIFGEDYDFAVYGPSVDCQNLGPPVRCSYAAPFGSASTGMNGASSDTEEGASGNGYVRWLNVSPGESYYILIDNFSSSFQGFTLNWTGSGVLDCSVTLPCPEVDLGTSTSVCDGGTLELGRQTGPSDIYLWSTGETTPSITVADSGLYWQEVTRNGCTIRDSVYVSISETPEVNIGNDTLLCEGQSVTIDASNPSATGYLWSDGYLSPIRTLSDAGTWSVQVFNEGCVGTDEIVIDIDPIPVVDLGRDTVLCNSAGILLVGTTAEADNYLWQDSSTGPTYSVTQSGTYWLQTSNEACVYTDSVRIDFGVFPVFDLGEDQTLCEGESVRLDAYAPEGTDYLWQDSSTSSELTVTAGGVYSVTVSNAECAVYDEVTLTFLPYPQLELGPDTTLCEGEVFLLNAYSPEATDYAWQDGSGSDTFRVISPGIYYVSVANDLCISRDTIEIRYKNLPRFNLGPDTLLCRGTPYPIVVEGEPDYVYTWSDGSATNAITVREQGEYLLEVSNSCGMRTDTINVIYGSCDCDFNFPTAFSPNGDGINDQFFPFTDCDSLQAYHFEIFNRWGELLFATDDVDEAWPGTGEMAQLAMDAYVWHLYYRWTWRGNAMQRRENGHFVLIR